MNFLPMTMPQDQRMVSKIFFSRGEPPAYDDATGSEGVCLKYPMKKPTDSLFEKVCVTGLYRKSMRQKQKEDADFREDSHR